jgi:hypothetical protein
MLGGIGRQRRRTAPEADNLQLGGARPDAEDVQPSAVSRLIHQATALQGWVDPVTRRRV